MVSICGKNKKIMIKDSSVLRYCTFQIFGNDNTITIGSHCFINGGNFWIEDCGGEIEIGDRTTILGKTSLAVIEGTRIEIGKDCMFSSNISIRTGDSHSIIDSCGKRINPSMNVKVGNHVWLGAEVMYLKGAVISDNSIIGTRTLVNKPFEEENVVLVGSPARIVNRNINWDRERIKIN